MDDAEFLEKQNALIALCPEVDDILYTLKNYLGVTFLRYVKSYPDGNKIILTNNPEWMREYFKVKFYETELADYSKHPLGSKGVHVHHECTKDHPVCNFWNRNGKIGNYNSKIAFFTKFQNYFEMFDFAMNGDMHKTNDAFFNNQHIYQHFFLYFKSRGRNLLQQAELAKFPSPVEPNYDFKNNWLLGISAQTTVTLLQEMPLLEFYLDDEFEKIPLTLNEAKSLRFFLEGYSFKSALELIGVTEDDHINTLNKVMAKLSVKSYNDLRSLCYQRNIANKLTFLNTKIKF